MHTQFNIIFLDLIRIYNLMIIQIEYVNIKYLKEFNSFITYSDLILL